MRIRGPVIALVALVVAGTALSVARAWLVPSQDRSKPVPLDALDRCVQARFQTVNKAFGLDRVSSHIAHMPSSFRPANAGEERALAAFRDGGWSGGIYLGARTLRTGDWDEARWKGTRSHFPIQGPVSLNNPLGWVDLIKRTKTAEDLPKSADLWEEGRKAMDASETSDRRESTLGTWTISARAVRATREECLGCHSHGYLSTMREGDEHNARLPDLKIGDPIGVLLYVYKRR